MIWNENYQISLFFLVYLFSHLLLTLAIKQEWNKNIKYRVAVFIVIAGLMFTYFVILYPHNLFFDYAIRAGISFFFWKILSYPIDYRPTDDAET